jgi:hypothetical protein
MEKYSAGSVFWKDVAYTNHHRHHHYDHHHHPLSAISKWHKISPLIGPKAASLASAVKSLPE